MKHSISNGQITFVSDTHGAEPWELKFNDENVNYVWRPAAGDIGASVCFPLLGSFPGDKYFLDDREYKMGMHGFARNYDFTVDKKTPDRIVYGLTYNNETLEQYPYPFRFRVVYAVSGAALITEYRVKNLGKREMFFSVGGHPHYACPIGEDEACFGDYFLEFSSPVSIKSVVKSLGPLDVIERHISGDGKRIMLDDEVPAGGAFCLSPVSWENICLKSLKSKRCLKMETDGANHMQFWTTKGADFICIEPFFGSITPLNPKPEDVSWTERPGTLRISPGFEWKGGYTVTINR